MLSEKHISHIKCILPVCPDRLTQWHHLILQYRTAPVSTVLVSCYNSMKSFSRVNWSVLLLTSKTVCPKWNTGQPILKGLAANLTAVQVAYSCCWAVQPEDWSSRISGENQLIVDWEGHVEEQTQLLWWKWSVLLPFTLETRMDKGIINWVVLKASKGGCKTTITLHSHCLYQC